MKFIPKDGLPTCLFCVCCAVAIASAGTGLRAGAQTPSTDVSFEVATVKPVDPSYHFDGTHHWAHVNRAGASYWYMTPIDLIAYAYDVEQFQIAGPEWAKHDYFDIEARFSEGADPKDDGRMLQALLKERFKLAFHIEKREAEVHVLVVGKRGEKLKPSLPDPVSPEAEGLLKAGDSNVAGVPAKAKITKNQDGSTTMDFGKRGTDTFKFDVERGVMHSEVSKITMEELANNLSVCLGSGVQKVVDETGIKGTYQLAWDCPTMPPRAPAGSDSVGMPASDPLDGSALTQSLDALGLKLEKRKVLQDVYVIDHVDKPSEN